MFFEQSVWDWLLIAAAAYIAFMCLVHMMREYRKKMIVQLKTTLIKRQFSQKRQPQNEA